MEMILAKSFGEFSRDFPKFNQSYKGSVIEINLAMLNIQMSVLPTLNYFPPNWEEIKSQYALLRRESMKWANSVLYKLHSVPQSIMDKNGIISFNLEKALEYCRFMAEKGHDEDVKNFLLKKIHKVISSLGFVSTMITGVSNSLNKFRKSLIQMIESLEVLLSESEEAVTFDHAVVAEIKNKVKTLQSELNKANRDAVVSGSIAVNSAIIGGALAAFGGPAGPFVSLFFFGASFYFGREAVDNSLEVIEKQGVIDLKKLEADRHTVDIASLTVFIEQLKNILATTISVQDSLQLIRDRWDLLNLGVLNMYNNILKAKGHVDYNAYSRAVRELEAAEENWESIFEQTKNLVLDINVTEAKIPMGTPANEVINKVSQSTMISNLQFFNVKAS